MTRQKVLVVDDEEDIVRSTEVLLSYLGYDTIPLLDARRVLEVAGREHPDLILQDLRMKDLEIPKLLSDLRARTDTADIPVVLFSASPEVAQVAAEQDAGGYLTKPFSEEQLALLLDRVLGAKAAHTKANLVEATRENVRALFHDYSNVIASMNAYHRALLHSPSLSERDRRIIKELERLVGHLERRTDALRSNILALVG